MSFTFQPKSNGDKNKLVATIKKKTGKNANIYIDLTPKLQNPVLEVESKEDKIIPLIDTTLRSVLYVAGPSGSGKSWFVNKWLNNALTFYKHQPLFFFSPVEEDPSLEGLPLVRADMEAVQDLADLTLDDLKDSFVIFDDCETIADKSLLKVLNNLRDIILERGRHTDTKMVITSHLITNYKETRRILNEATAIVVYPKSAGKNNIKKYLSNYMGFSKDQIAKVFDVEDRWIFISKTYPIYCLTESKLFIP
jgi:hypothetical protein